MEVGPVAGADDADGHGVELAEPQGQGQQNGQEDAELAGRPQHDDPGVGEQRPEVGHGADADEDQHREDLGADAEVVEEPQRPALGHELGLGDVDEDGAEADGHEQQGLEPLPDSQVEQPRADGHHHHLAEPQVRNAVKQPQGAGNDCGFHVVKGSGRKDLLDQEDQQAQQPQHQQRADAAHQRNRKAEFPGAHG